jgi:hypothetical protein
VLQVCIDKVIWMMPVDHNDEMEMRVNGAMLVNYIVDGDANTSVNNRNTAAVVAVPQSLSFYTMFYKMMIEDRCRSQKRKKRRVEDKKKKKKKGRCICAKCERIDTCMMPSSSHQRVCKTLTSLCGMKTTTHTHIR